MTTSGCFMRGDWVVREEVETLPDGRWRMEQLTVAHRNQLITVETPTEADSPLIVEDKSDHGI